MLSPLPVSLVPSPRARRADRLWLPPVVVCAPGPSAVTGNGSLSSRSPLLAQPLCRGPSSLLVVLRVLTELWAPLGRGGLLLWAGAPPGHFRSPLTAL